MLDGDMYITPEGFGLYRRLLLPYARSFSDLMEVCEDPEPRLVGRNEIGPTCIVDRRQLDGERYSFEVRATDVTVEAVANWILTTDDHLSFMVIGHVSTKRALVILEHSQIVGSHWIAYIDPTTVPEREETAS